MRKKIVFFVGSMGNGGAQRVISLLTEFLRSKYSVKVLSYYNTDLAYDIPNDVELESVIKLTHTKNIIKNIFFIRKYITDSDIFISFMAPFNIIALLSVIGTKKKIIVADRNDPKFVPNKSIYRHFRDLMYNRANAVIVQTTNNKKYFSKKIQGKTFVIYNPVIIDNKFKSIDCAIKEDIIVSVGRLVPQKNHELLIRAFALFHESFPSYKLIIYGEGASRSELQRLIGQLGLENFVKLPGSVSDVFDKLSCAKVFVLSSDYEGMPNALIEAMCVGLPVISTKVSGATDLIKNGVNGDLVDCGDEKGLANTLLSLISDENRMLAYSQSAKLIEKDLGIDSIVKQWNSVIETVFCER